MNVNEHENKAETTKGAEIVMIPWRRDHMMGWHQQVDVCPLYDNVAGQSWLRRQPVYVPFVVVVVIVVLPFPTRSCLMVRGKH